jgi:hypothetical protein
MESQKHFAYVSQFIHIKNFYLFEHFIRSEWIIMSERIFGLEQRTLAGFEEALLEQKIRN